MQVIEPTKIKRYYRALVNREEEYVGIFFVGVKTTSIFCISTCRARKPKLENVDFFTSLKDVLDNGYRPCKVCRPTENATTPPPGVEMAMKLVRDYPKEKIKDQQLRDHGVQPEQVRRWFKKHYGVTFHAYQRMFRINNAYQELRNGKNATQTAYDTGYESLSGFGYSFKKLTGKSPSAKPLDVIHINRLTTPLGPMFVGATERGVCLLEFVDRRMLETEFRDLQRLLNAQILLGDNVHITQVKRELKEYFKGSRHNFDVLLDTPGTEFQRNSWQALQSIPYGTTVSYQEQAGRIGNPDAVRAVARANGANRVAIMIPCHRVIGKNGKLTGYGGGLERKKWLLAHERSNVH